ncbi:tyrosine-protein phosphatase [Gordonia sp. HY285]|uniref:tyrosine-protein phosphatase n=1 Tax=Gordonia liuliyuniae TaxID=2911517 RepID=UPI001F40A385|nr:tyrosine-protein phosphatase [Gordonia liuliyuniae]MCF8609516.1 tyrosine-protein phosphatase [Gordonia liuliyuniae]
MTDVQKPNGQPGAPSPIVSLPNMRDLGGWRGSDGRAVRPGLLYRTADFAGISADDAKLFAALGVRTVYDLRSKAERAAAPDLVFDGVDDIALDVLADSETAIPASLGGVFADPTLAVELNKKLKDGTAAAAIAGTYRDMITLPSANTAYARFFAGLAGVDRAPVAFHCTAGKDRTGWAAASLLAVLGVSRDDVFADYLLTNDRLVPALKPIFDKFASEGGDPDLLLPILGVRKEYLASAFEEVDSRYGSIEGYLTDGLGLDASVPDTLRASFLE